MAEQHPPVGRHVIGVVLEYLGGSGIVVARLDDVHLDQSRVEPEPDHVGADRGDDEPHRIDRLSAEERDDRPRDRAHHRDDPKMILCLVVMGDRSMIATGGKSLSVRIYVTSPSVSSMRSDVLGAVTMPSLDDAKVSSLFMILAPDKSALGGLAFRLVRRRKSGWRGAPSRGPELPRRDRSLVRRHSSAVWPYSGMLKSRGESGRGLLHR